MTSKTKDDLETRITTALADENIAAKDVATLITETEHALAAADLAVEDEQTKAFDPALSPDPKTARQVLEDAEFIAQRLETLLPRLHEKHEDRRADEYSVIWCDEFARLEVERDELADELRLVYSDAAQHIVDVLARIAPLDRQILEHGVRAPEGLHERLQSVELAARGIAGIGHNQFSVVRDLVLPDFDDPSRKLWPLAEPTPQWTTFAGVPRHSGRYSADWHEAQIEFDAERAALKQQQGHAAAK